MASRTFRDVAGEGLSSAKMHESEMANVFVYFLEMVALGRARELFLASRSMAGFSQTSLLLALSLVSKKISEGRRGPAGKKAVGADWAGLAPVFEREIMDAEVGNEGGGAGKPGDFGGEGGFVVPKPPKIIAGKKAEEKIAELVFLEIASFAPGDFKAQEEIAEELQKRCSEKGFRQELLATTLLLVEEEKRFGGEGPAGFDPADASGGKAGIRIGAGKEIVFASTREMMYRYLDSHPKEAEWLAQEMGVVKARGGGMVAFGTGKSKEEVAEDLYNRLKKKNVKNAGKFLLEFGLFKRGGRRYVCKRHWGSEALGGVPPRLGKLLGSPRKAN